MLNFTPRVHSDLEIDPPADGYRIVHNRATGRYFRLGSREAGFLEALDGSRPVDALCRSNAEGFSPEQVGHLIAWFAAQRLLADLPAPAGQAGADQGGSWLKRLVTVDRWRVKLVDPDPFLQRHRVAVDSLFGRLALSFYLLAALMPAILVIAAPQLAVDAFAAFTTELPARGWLSLYLMMVTTIVLHELAHAVACKHFGGKVGVIGIMLLYLHPVPYCDVSDSWRFRERGHRIGVAAAGIFLQLILSGIALTAWLATAAPVLGHYVILNTAIALFNFFPLVKLDGYWMLVHLVGEPNLRHKGLAALDGLVRRLVGRPATFDWRARPGLLAFGAAHAVAVPIFWGLGLFAVFRLGSLVSPLLGFGLLALVGGLFAWRAVHTSLRYVHSLRSA